MFKTFTLSSSLIAVLMLSGCGSDSNFENTAISVPQTHQINKQITTKSIETGKSLILSANGIQDAKYIEWYDENGKLLSTDKELNRLFDKEGEYKIYLSITDKNNQVSTDEVIVKVNRAPEPVQTTPNQAPIVKAKAEASDIMDLESIHLSDDGSYDPDGTIVKYEWRDMDGILLSDTKRLDRVLHYDPQYDFKHNGTTRYVKTLYVTDDKGAVSSKSIEIIVHKKPNSNKAPTVNAGADKTITEGQSVILTATASDRDGTIASYEWKEGGVVKGNSATLTLNNLSKGVHFLTVTVTDDKGATASDTVKVEVKEVAPTNHAPTANQQSITLDEDTSKAITLSGTDPDGDALTYTLTAQPSHGTLTGTAPNLTYTPTANYNGSDSFKFKVSDGKVESGEALVNITIQKSSSVQPLPYDETHKKGIAGEIDNQSYITSSLLNEEKLHELVGKYPSLKVVGYSDTQKGLLVEYDSNDFKAKKALESIEYEKGVNSVVKRIINPFGNYQPLVRIIKSDSLPLKLDIDKLHKIAATSGSNSVQIGIVDGGFATTKNYDNEEIVLHQDLKGRFNNRDTLWTPRKVKKEVLDILWDNLKDDGIDKSWKLVHPSYGEIHVCKYKYFKGLIGSKLPEAIFSHGIRVAGIIGAKKNISNNNQGINQVSKLNAYSFYEGGINIDSAFRESIFDKLSKNKLINLSGGINDRKFQCKDVNQDGNIDNSEYGYIKNDKSKLNSFIKEIMATRSYFLTGEGKDVLLVQSAGNDKQDSIHNAGRIHYTNDGKLNKLGNVIIVADMKNKVK